MLCEKGAAVICSPWKKEHHPLLIYIYIYYFFLSQGSTSRSGSVWQCMAAWTLGPWSQWNSPLKGDLLFLSNASRQRFGEIPVRPYQLQMMWEVDESNVYMEVKKGSGRPFSCTNRRFHFHDHFRKCRVYDVAPCVFSVGQRPFCLSCRSRASANMFTSSGQA